MGFGVNGAAQELVYRRTWIEYGPSYETPRYYNRGGYQLEYGRTYWYWPNDPGAGIYSSRPYAAPNGRGGWNYYGNRPYRP